jgi:hypothetical protein
MWLARPAWVTGFSVVAAVFVGVLVLTEEQGAPTRFLVKLVLYLYATWYYWPAGLAAYGRRWPVLSGVGVVVAGTLWALSAQSVLWVAHVARLLLAGLVLVVFATGAWIVDGPRLRRLSQACRRH